jgi:hypothetical protein
MHTAPTAISHGALNHASASPATAADPEAHHRGGQHRRGAASFEPTSRSGPARTSSVPRMPSE